MSPKADDAGKVQVSSPSSTGGEGVFFEQHVGAYWLAQLLTGSFPPILTDAVVAEVHFQTEHLGFATDDVLAVCERIGAASATLACQIKRSFTVSAADEECRKAIGDFWKDFRKANPFDPTTDRLLLVTLRGTDTLLEFFVGLLDAARAATDGEEFERRLSLKGFISKKSIRQCDELCKIVSGIEGVPVTAGGIWPFLRVLHVLSLDLHSSTSQTEAHIKTLLALKSTAPDPAMSANATWDALVALASTASPAARSLKRADLPRELLDAYGSVGADERNVLTALRNHTEFVLGKIRTTIGPGFHLSRASVVQRVLEATATHQVVLVTGPAGGGKSAIGKEVATLLARNHFAFAFRVEEFAEAHIDTAFRASQIPATPKRVQELLASQGRKLVVIESVERLLEKPTRDAFSDLMMLAAADNNLQILLTCRDYSVEQVRASFLQPAGIGHVVIEVPRLDDSELAEIQVAFPALAAPFARPALRDILRNPYFLDKALRIQWTCNRPMPENERDLRALLWSHVVRADDRPADGMPHRREQALQEIAVRRARALSAYVTSTGLDPAAVGLLRQDSVVVSPDSNPLLVAPAHDVLEDWAILQWMEAQHLTGETSFTTLATAIGPHPAVRRSYRKWVAELLDRDRGEADRLFTLGISLADVPAQFRDDTLISLLKAPSASDFLARHEASLIGNDRKVLKRVIHLLRVACVTAPAWLGRIRGHSSLLNVPDGPAWATVLRLVHHNLDSFSPEDRPLLLALVEDAVRGVAWWAPDLDGAEHVAGIAHWLLPRYRGYRDDDSRKRVLRVIAKIPKADPARFEAVLRGQAEGDEGRDHVADEFRELLLSGLDGMPAARDVPEVLLSVAREALLLSKDHLRTSPYLGPSLDVDIYFGVKGGHLDFFPASAIRGPWTQLLTRHPRKGLDFLIDVFNHSAKWYAKPPMAKQLEPAWEVDLTFSDGSTSKQWVNPRLWGLYRGISVGPYSLQTLLMAFERWLLDYAHKYPDRLDELMLEVLRRTESAALSAVVASVATAHPHKSGETLLVLLSVRDYVVIDRSRMAIEHRAPGVSGLFPTLRAEHKLYEEERKTADGLPHRRMDLEAAVGNLQFGPLAQRAHSIIDRHLAALPPIESRSEEDLTWQLALHRMDLRQFDVAEADGAQEGTPAGHAGGEPAKAYLRLEPRPPAPEVQELVDRAAKTHDAMNARLSVYLWGLKLFQRESGPDPSQWREKIAAAQAMDPATDQPDNTHNAPGFVAAVCVRDFWDEMSAEQQAWCVEVMCSELTRRANHWGTTDRLQRFSMAADRPCASVVAALLCKPLTDPQTRRVHDAFVIALTHPIEEVRWYATWGIDARFWTANPALALRAVNAVATEAATADHAWRREEGRPYNKRRAAEKVLAEAAESVRKTFWREDGFAEDAHIRLDTSAWNGAEANTKILTMLGQAGATPLTLAAFLRASQALTKCWDDEGDRSSRPKRNYEREGVVRDRIQTMVMQASDADAQRVLQPILDAVDLHPREVHDVIQGLTSSEDTRPNTTHYWFLWNLFAERVKRATWLAHLDSEHPYGSEVLSTIFLTAWWKDEVTHWRSLEGNAHRVDQLFDALPPSWIVLDSYVRFLYHIGERSLPPAFLHLASSLKRGNAADMLRNSDTVFMLEVLLQRHVYARPLELKRDPALREGILFLLDTLVEGGSSAAFRMRDDFVTPAA